MTTHTRDATLRPRRRPYILAPMKDRMISLLASGVPPAQVARAVGVSESYLSQLQTSDERFRKRLAEATSTQLARTVEIREGYETLEQGILEQMKDMLATSDMKELTGALSVVSKANQMRALGGSNGGSGGGSSATVVLNLPVHVVRDIEVKTNARNEIVEIDGKSMIPLTPTQVQAKLTSLQKEFSHADKKSEAHQGLSTRFEEIERLTGE